MDVGNGVLLELMTLEADEGTVIFKFHDFDSVLVPILFCIIHWATVCKTVRPMLWDRCLSICPVSLSVCL